MTTTTLPASRRAGRSDSALSLADAAALLGLIGLAVALRVPTLLTVPRFGDEQLDVLYTLPLYRLQALPQVGFDPYNGPLFSILLAVALWLIGPEPSTPRLVPLLAGIGTVVATYFLGRQLGGRMAGLVAGALLGTSAVHVIVNSHIAWSNATTPFFTTLAFLAIMPAITLGSGPRLVLGTLAFALALQTHPSVVALLPGVGLAVLLKRRPLVWSRWSILAALVFVLAYSNVLAYNLGARGNDGYWQLARAYAPAWGAATDGTFGRLSHEQRMNAEGQIGPGSEYTSNLATLALNLPRLAGSLIELRAMQTDFLREPLFWLYGLVVLLGLLGPLRQGNPLPALAGLSYVLVLPIFNAKYEPIYNGRYVMPLLPLAFAGFGALVSDLWCQLRISSSPSLRVWGRLALVVAVCGLVLWPVFPLSRYVQRMAPEGEVNLDLIESAGVIATAQRPGEPILLDETLGRRGLGPDGDLLMNLQLFLQLRGVPHRIGPATSGKLDGELGGARTAVVVFATPYDRPLEARYRFRELEEKSTPRYTVYRVERRG